MENKPVYRIRVIIEDVNVGEEIVNMSDAIYSTDEDTAMLAYRAIAVFRGTAKPTHESIFYPSETEE